MYLYITHKKSIYAERGVNERRDVDGIFYSHKKNRLKLQSKQPNEAKEKIVLRKTKEHIIPEMVLF